MEEARTGRYRIVERIAEGGMAVVDRAVAEGPDGFERELVVKRVLPRFSRDERFARMFVDEARIVSQLHHPNIVQVYEFGKVDDQYFIAMEYVPGVDLSRLKDDLNAAGERFPIPLAMFVVIEICRALDYAHRKTGPDGRPLGIVHRDVSPQNVLISVEGAVKLADFGIARAAERREKTLDGVVKGKVAYMSPEQLRGEELDGRSDVYSAALVLYVLLAGRHPYAQANETRTIEAALAHSWPAVTRVAADVPERLDDIVTRGTAFKRENRYATAAELGDELERFLFQERLRASASELAALMQGRYDGAPPPALPAADRPVNLDGVVAAEIRRLGGGATTLPTYTLSAPAEASPDQARSGAGTRLLYGAPAAEQSRVPAPSRAEEEALRGPGAGAGGGDGPVAQPVPPHGDQAEEHPAAAQRLEAAVAAAPRGRRRPRGLLGALVVVALAGLGGAGALLWLGGRAPAPTAPLADASFATSPLVGASPPRASAGADAGAAADGGTAVLALGEIGDGSPERSPEASGEADAAPPRRHSPHRAGAEAAPGPRGWLRVLTRPHYAEVFVDGRRRGTTPLLVEVPAGRRSVRLVNTQIGRSERRTVEVPARSTSAAPATLSVDEF